MCHSRYVTQGSADVTLVSRFVKLKGIFEQAFVFNMCLVCACKVSSWAPVEWGRSSFDSWLKLLESWISVTRKLILFVRHTHSQTHYWLCCCPCFSVFTETNNFPRCALECSLRVEIGALEYKLFPVVLIYFLILILSHIETCDPASLCLATEPYRYSASLSNSTNQMEKEVSACIMFEWG